MSDNTFDNDLPPWLQGDDSDADESEGGAGSFDFDFDAPSPHGTGALKGLTGKLPWNAEQSAAPTGDTDDLPPWLADSSPGSTDSDRTGVTGSLEWLADDSGRGSTDANAVGFTRELEWRQEDFERGSGGSGASGITDELDWRQDEGGADPGAGTPGLTASLEWKQSSDEREPSSLPDWLSGAPAEPSPPSIDEMPADESSDEVMINTAALDQAASEALPDWMRSDTSEFTSRSETDEDLFPASTSSAASSEEGGFDEWAQEHGIDDTSWMGQDDADTFGGNPQDDPFGGLTYDEWERQQDEAERQATAPPEVPLPDMPDWFENVDEQAPVVPPPPAGAKDYVPDWFLGVEELDHADAPDWLKGVDLGTGDLIKPAPAPEPTPAAPPPSSPLEMPPDFMSELPGFDDIVPPDLSDITGELPASPVRRIEPPPAAVSLDDLLLDEEDTSPPPQEPPQIRRIASAPEPASMPDFDTLSFDDLGAMPGDDLFGDAPADMSADMMKLPNTGDLMLSGIGEEPAPSSDLDAGMGEPAFGIDDLFGDDDAALPGDLDTTADDFGIDDLFGETAPDMMELPSTGDLSLSDSGEEAPSFGDFDALPDDAGIDDLFGETAPDMMELPSTGDLMLPDTPALDDEDAEPDWLKDYDQASELEAMQPEKRKPDTGSLDPDALPDWLDEMDFGEMPAAPPMPEPTVMEEAPADDAFDLDAFLDELPFASEGGGVETPQADSLTPSGSSDISFDDDFFSELDALAPVPSTEAPPLEPAEDFGLERAELAEGDSVPEWMLPKIGTVATDEYVLKSGGVEERFQQVPPVVLPSDLRDLRERIVDLLEQQRAEGIVELGPLKGIAGALGIDADMVAPGEVSMGTSYDLTESQQHRLASLERILEIVREETEAEKIEISYGVEKEVEIEEIEEALEAEPRAKPRRRRARPDRLLVTLVLLVVTLLPFASDSLHLADDPPTELDENALPLAAAVDTLEDAEADKPLVLFAFEYSPAAAPELDPLAEAVLRDVITHGGVPVVISTNPMGILHARHVIETLAADEALLASLPVETPTPPQRPEALDNHIWNAVLEQWRLSIPELAIEYVILPYLPGGAVGVRSLVESDSARSAYFARDINGDETDLTINALDEDTFAFLVVVGERHEDARLWAEQFHAVNIPKFALVTAAAEPLTRPYIAANVYDGMLSGLRGRLVYDAQRNAENRAERELSDTLPDPDVSSWHSAALGAIAAAIIIGIGTLFNLLRSLRRRRA